MRPQTVDLWSTRSPGRPITPLTPSALPPPPLPDSLHIFHSSGISKDFTEASTNWMCFFWLSTNSGCCLEIWMIARLRHCGMRLCMTWELCTITTVPHTPTINNAIRSFFWLWNITHRLQINANVVQLLHIFLWFELFWGASFADVQSVKYVEIIYQESE